MRNSPCKNACVPGFWLVTICYCHITLVLVEVLQLDGDDVLSTSFNVWIFVVLLQLGIGIMATIALVALKCLLFGKVVDGVCGGA